MTRVFTILDLGQIFLSLCGKLITAMARSHNKMLASLVTLSLLTTALAIFLSYRCVQISKLRNAYITDELSSQSHDLYNHLSDTNIQQSLLRNMPPLTVHYMWCLKSHFEFKHYLGILSIAKVLRPDQIIFHYLELPLSDAKGYFVWFEDIQREVAMLSLKPIKDPRLCSHDFSRGVEESEDFPNPSGIFMTDEVAVTNLTRESYFLHRKVSQQSVGNCPKSDGSVCKVFKQEPFQLFLVPASEPYVLNPGPGRAVFECPSIDVINRVQNFSTGCVQLSHRIFPSDIWRQNRTFERFARKIILSDSEPVFAVPAPKQSAPNIAHILKFDGESGLSPLCYVSILSAFTNGELHHVFVHGHLDRRKPDPLWQRLVKEFHLTHVPTPGITASTPKQRQLLYGINVLLQYGGILLTCDTIVQKPVEPLLQYPSVLTVKKTIYRIIYHHVDFSAMVASPGSSFLRSLTPVLKQLTEAKSERDFGAVAYHIYEQHPTSAWIEASLVGHMTCRPGKCLPAEGQLDVRHAFAVKFTWVEGSPPPTVRSLAELSTTLSAMLRDVIDQTAIS